VFLEGYPLSDPFTGACDLNALPLEWVTKIEVGRGGVVHPAGGFSPLGALSILTWIHPARRPLGRRQAGQGLPPPKAGPGQGLHGREGQAYSRVTYKTGSHGLSDVAALFSRPFSSRLMSLFGGDIQGYNGRFLNSRYDAQRLWAWVDYALSPRWHVTYRWLYYRVEAGFPGAVSPLTGVSENSQTHRKVRRHDHILWLTWRESTHLTGQGLLYHRSRLIEWTDKPRGVHVRRPVRTLGLVWIQKGRYGKHEGYLSVRAQWLTARLFRGESIGETSLWLTASDRWQPFPSLSLQGSASWGYWGKRGSGMAGSLGILYRTHGGVDFIAQLAKGSVPPPRSIFYADPSPYYPPLRPDETLPRYRNLTLQTDVRLSPEEAVSLEFGLRRSRLPNKFSLLAFGYQISNGLQYQLDSTSVRPTNSARWRVWGIEASLDRRFGPYFRTRAIYTLQMSPSADGTSLPEAPRHQFRAWIAYGNRFFQEELGVTLQGSLEYKGPRWGVRWNGDRQQTTLVDLPDVLLLHAKLLLDFGEAIVFFEVENILNQSYEIVPGYPMPGKTIRYGIRWEFWD